MPWYSNFTVLQRGNESLLAGYTWISNVHITKRLTFFLLFKYSVFIFPPPLSLTAPKPTSWNFSAKTKCNQRFFFVGEGEEDGNSGRNDRRNHDNIIRYSLEIYNNLEIILCITLFIIWLFIMYYPWRQKFLFFIWCYVLSRSCSVNIWIKKWINFAFGYDTCQKE